MALPARIAESTGTAWYVKPASEGGDDSRTQAQAQSESTPWATIGHAISTIPDLTGITGGAKILVYSGTYSERIQHGTTNTARNGDATHVLTIEGYGPTRPILQYVAAQGDCLSFYGEGAWLADYIRWRNFEIKGYNHTANGAGVTLYTAGHIEVDRCLIHDHRPSSAGTRAQGIYADAASSYLQVWNTLIHSIDPAAAGQDNLSHCAYIECSDSYMVNCICRDAGKGFGMQFYSGGANSQRNGLFHCVMAHNAKGGAIFDGSIIDLEVRNSIFAFNGTYGLEGYYEGSAGSNQTAEYNVIHGNTSGDYFENNALHPMTLANNLSGDPLFVSAAGRDYHLLSGSPAIAAGHASFVPVTDLELIARVAADIGAYEYATGGGNAPSLNAVTRSGMRLGG